MKRGLLFAILVCAWAGTPALRAQEKEQPLDINLPTANTALYTGEYDKFYQVVERDFEGVKSTPWQGGQYGFVRDPVETPQGIVYTRFHEGVDIKPLQRDAGGMPLDPVMSIANGTVAYANATAGFSNYGKYVVVDHLWGGCHYYSLYAHLNKVVVTAGQKVAKGDQLGVLGFTGEGLDMPRAHVHFEINLMLSSAFDAWHTTYFPGDVNHHGNYNGINLAGFNPAAFLLALKKNPALTVPDFLSHEEVFYKVLIPRSAHFDLPKFYPWMLDKKSPADPASWEVSFTQSGVPLHIATSGRQVDAPELSWAKPAPIEYSKITRDVISGKGDHAELSTTGLHLMKLLISPD